MSRREKSLVVSVAALCGLVGGSVSAWLRPDRALAQEASEGKAVVAREFRLVDANGNMAAVLRLQGDGQPLLIMKDRSGQPGIMMGTSGHPFLSIKDDSVGEVNVVIKRDHPSRIHVCDKDGRAVWQVP